MDPRPVIPDNATYARTRYRTYQPQLDAKLFRAFNPDREIRNRTPLEKEFSKMPFITNPADFITTEERIIESGMIRRQLLVNLTATEFVTLQLIYQQFPLMDNLIAVAIDLFASLIRDITRNAQLLVSQCDQQFAALCCLSTAWNTNLFRKKNWGPITRYYYQMAACRKRRRLNDALEVMRQTAVAKAYRVLRDDG